MVPYLFLVIVIFFVLILFFTIFPIGLWIRARASGVPVRISALIGMRLRHISPQKIVDSYIRARKAGLDLTTVWLAVTSKGSSAR